jgi:hypothetical protein
VVDAAPERAAFRWSTGPAGTTVVVGGPDKVPPPGALPEELGAPAGTSLLWLVEPSPPAAGVPLDTWTPFCQCTPELEGSTTVIW